MGTQSSALHKQTWISSRIEAAGAQGVSIDQEKFLAEFCIANSSTRKTGLEIIKNLEFTGKIVLRGGDLFTPELFREYSIKEKDAAIQEQLNSEEK
ncbi:hypothetical protein LCGC14_1587590 [marine sediment metagenome]|uniref:Uncharacterized protein n=1 Tax=marine sediment metagenome TaxID=412755 RepID=A0A0F9LFB0_9ZZZZ